MCCLRSGGWCSSRAPRDNWRLFGNLSAIECINRFKILTMPTSFKHVTTAAIAAIAVSTTASLALGPSEEVLDRACTENLLQLKLRMWLYAVEHNLLLPPLQMGSEPVRLAPDELDLATQTDLPILRPTSFVSPALELRPEAQTAPHSDSYWYLGSAVESEAEGLRYAHFVRNRKFETSSVPFNSCYGGFRMDMTLLSDDSYTFPPLFLDGTTRPMLFQPDWQLVPLLIERPQLHGHGGHVLWADGRIEFIPYPGKFPMTEKFIAALEELDPGETPLD